MKACTLAFDLDDTLYDERQYLRSGLAWVAGEFASPLGVSEAVLVSLFETLLAEGGREKIFDRALAALGLRADVDLIQSMVTHYRNQHPNISLYPGVQSLLETLRVRYRLVLVTDGLPSMQRSKVAALKLESAFERILYCWEHDAPKPDASGYRLAIGEPALDSAIIIGDNPGHDGVPAKALGIPFVRIRSSRFADVPGGDLVLDSVTELPGVLSQVPRGGQLGSRGDLRSNV